MFILNVSYFLLGYKYIGGIMVKVHGILILFKVYIYKNYYLGIKLK